MKKFLLFAVTCITFISCRYHRDRDVSITYSDDDRHYSMDAHFSKKKIREVERYMDRTLGETYDMSFTNSRMDSRITDDHTLVYIKKYPGHIKIKLDKYENSEEAYERVREICEGIEEVLIVERR